MFAFLRRRLARRAPFPEAWREVLQRRVPFWSTLDAGTRARFEEKLKVFVRTKTFEGAGGFVVDEEAKVVIAAGAVRLSVNLPGEDYERLSTVVVYPAHYQHQEKDGVVFGEANRWGTVVLSYASVLAGLKNPADGQDVALHEFAHALDIEDGAFDGTPELSGRAYAPWARVMSEAFLDLRGKGGKRRAVLRHYGATNEAEFFAVATEAFYEKPRQLREKHPELYELLAEFYRADPAAS